LKKFQQTLIEIFLSNLDSKIFIAIMIVIEKPIRINQIPIKKY